ncbi:MAG: hypothetical protein ABIS86_03685 [Streptosporangiaceae bacterium]
MVAALTEPGHVGELYEVTGPRLLTFAQVATELTAVLGREISYVPMNATEYAQMLTSHGVPEAETGLLVALFTEVLDGRNASLADGVQRALGRAPRDFTDYVRANADVWNH